MSDKMSAIKARDIIRMLKGFENYEVIFSHRDYANADPFPEITEYVAGDTQLVDICSSEREIVFSIKLLEGQAINE